MALARQLMSRLGCQAGRRSLTLTTRVQHPDQETHTGQQFSESDPRNVRFAVTGLQKQVNNKWAIDLIAEVPPIRVNKRVVGVSPPLSLLSADCPQVACDGGGGALGHPKVYINLDGGEPVACIYCGLRYVFDPNADDYVEEHGPIASQYQRKEKK